MTATEVMCKPTCHEAYIPKLLLELPELLVAQRLQQVGGQQQQGRAEPDCIASALPALPAVLVGSAPGMGRSHSAPAVHTPPH